MILPEYLAALRYISGLSDEEIAKKTGEEVSAVNAKILKFLKEYGKKVSIEENRSPSPIAAAIEAFKKEYAGFRPEAAKSEFPSGIDFPPESEKEEIGIPREKILWRLAGTAIFTVLLLSAGAYGFVKFFFASEPIDEAFEKQILSQIRNQDDFKKLKTKKDDGRSIVIVTRKNGEKQQYVFVPTNGQYHLKRFEKL